MTASQPTNLADKAVNWDEPSKRALVERAMADGVNDPKTIAEWMESRGVSTTVDEVLRLKRELSSGSQ